MLPLDVFIQPGYIKDFVNFFFNSKIGCSVRLRNAVWNTNDVSIRYSFSYHRYEVWGQALNYITFRNPLKFSSAHFREQEIRNIMEHRNDRNISVGFFYKSTGCVEIDNDDIRMDLIKELSCIRKDIRISISFIPCRQGRLSFGTSPFTADLLKKGNFNGFFPLAPKVVYFNVFF